MRLGLFSHVLLCKSAYLADFWVNKNPCIRRTEISEASNKGCPSDTANLYICHAVVHRLSNISIIYNIKCTQQFISAAAHL